MVAEKEVCLPWRSQLLRLLKMTAVDLYLLQNLSLCQTLIRIIQTVQRADASGGILGTFVICFDIINHGCVQDNKLRVGKSNGIGIRVVLRRLQP